MSELKPCPFCGGKISITYDSFDKTFNVWHTNNKCAMVEPIRIDEAKSFEQAIGIWNRFCIDEEWIRNRQKGEKDEIRYQHRLRQPN